MLYVWPTPRAKAIFRKSIERLWHEPKEGKGKMTGMRRGERGKSIFENKKFLNPESPKLYRNVASFVSSSDSTNIPDRIEEVCYSDFFFSLIT